MPLSSSSATPDETAELKRFFAQIERIKNQETPLKTPEERIGHNHMLIYVYARVVLDSLKWDDPFANRAHLQAEAAKAVSFLRVTIEETPEVLTCITDGRTFLFRSGEPLWVWVFPRILRLLGNPYCTPLVKDIELFFRQVFVSMMQSGSLWGEIPVFVQYLAEAVKGQ